MARPTKTKIDYFPLYCDYDERTEYLVAKFGYEGYGVYISLLKNLYGGNGYYLNWNDKAECIFSRNGNIDRNTVADIIDCLLDEGIFDTETFKKYSILTSGEIQENYLYAVSKRKNNTIDDRFSLVNSEKTGVNSEETRVNSSESTQRKENKRKENNTIKEGENKIASAYTENKENAEIAPAHKKKYGEFKNVILSESEYEALLYEHGDITPTIERLSQYMAATGKEYASHYAVLQRWAREDKPEPKPISDNSSYDINEFFELALKRSNEKILAKAGTGPCTL